MDVITISRQLGSLGSEIGKRLANQLSYRLVWRELINQAALRAGAPEVALAMIDDLGLLGINPTPEQLQAYLTAVEQVLAEHARQGRVVIIGRAGQVVLHDHPGVFHVRVVAPMDLRIRRVSRRNQVTPEAARAQIKASDRARQQYLRRAYQVDWEDHDLYDLVINTSRLDVDHAVVLIESVINYGGVNPSL